MLKIISKVVVVLVSAAGLGILGWLIGAYLGGNFAETFIFNGVRGYEATGQLGFLAGIATGFVLGIFLLFKRSKREARL